MSNLSWGKPRIFVKDLDTTGAKWKELPTPVQDSTELQPTKGDKMEAPVEGGQNEDVKYKDSKYAVVYNIRKKKGRKQPIPTLNGVAEKHYGFMLQPEDPTNIGFYIEETTVSVDDSFTAADGAIWQLQHDAIKAKSGNTVKWGNVELEETTITFTETDPAEGATAANVTGDVEVLSEAAA